MRIYCMSDIHGCLEPFLKALETVDMESEDSMLVLLGDYCDRGPDSLGVFRTVMGLQERYGERVIALRGNHEEQLLEYMSNVDNPDFAQAWKLADSNLATARSFLEPDEFEHMRHLLVLKRFEEAYRYTVGRIRKSHGDVIRWVGRLPYYWESPFGQVFVHAGIDEEAADLWRVGTPPEWFTAMLPMYAGEHFDLDVIAGHVSTETVSGIAGYRGSGSTARATTMSTQTSWSTARSRCWPTTRRPAGTLGRGSADKNGPCRSVSSGNGEILDLSGRYGARAAPFRFGQRWVWTPLTFQNDGADAALVAGCRRYCQDDCFIDVGHGMSNDCVFRL